MQAAQIHVVTGPLQITRDIDAQIQLLLGPAGAEIRKAVRRLRSPCTPARIGTVIGILPVLPARLLPDECEMRRAAGPMAVDEAAGDAAVGPRAAGLREDGRGEEAVRVRDEVVRRSCGRRHAADPLRRHLAQQLRVVRQLQLDRVRHRAGRAGCVRTQNPQQVGDPRRREPQVCVRVTPFSAREPRAAQVDVVRRDRERRLEVRVGARRGEDGVDAPVYAVRCGDACGCEAFDGRRDVCYVRCDKRFEVAWPGGQAAATG